MRPFFRPFARPLLPVLLALPAWFSVISCGASPWGTRVDWVEPNPATIPGPEQYPGEGAVILVDEGKLEIVATGPVSLSVFDRRRVVRIFNARGHRFAYVVIPFGQGTEVHSIRARTIGPDGTIAVLDPKNVFEVNLYPSFIFFSDQRAKLFTLPAVTDGAIVEYEYSMTIQGRAYWNAWVFQNDVPTLLSRFTLVKPRLWEVRSRSNGDEIQPKVEQYPTVSRSSHVWEARSIPGVVSEPAMPPARESAWHIAFSPAGFRTWQDVGQWYDELSAAAMKGDEGIARLAAAVAGEGTERERLRKIFEWVRDNVRYVAVEIGIGGYQPHPAEEVRANLYGDCKDMTTLLCALGRNAGLDVRQALISTWQNGLPDTALPSPSQFNHVIAYAPPAEGDSGVWMDATEKGCPFGSIPWYDQGLPALVVDTEGASTLMRTPRASEEANRERMEWDVSLSDSGSARIRGRTLFWGAPAAELREQIALSAPRALKQWLSTSLARRISGLTLDTVRAEGLTPVADPLILQYEFRAPAFGAIRGERMILRPAMIRASDLPDHFRSTERMHPVRFSYGSTVEQELTLHLPAGWDARPTRPHALVSHHGAAGWENSRGEGGVVVRSWHRLDGRDIPPQEYPDFRKFLDEMRSRDERELELVLTR